MAGFSSKPIINFVKKNALGLFFGYGFYCFYSSYYNSKKIYKDVYAKNHYERQQQLENLKGYIDENKEKLESNQNAKI